MITYRTLRDFAEELINRPRFWFETPEIAHGGFSMLAKVLYAAGSGTAITQRVVHRVADLHRTATAHLAAPPSKRSLLCDEEATVGKTTSLNAFEKNARKLLELIDEELKPGRDG